MKLFLDFDEVLADSIEAVLYILNKRYNKNVKFDEVKDAFASWCDPKSNVIKAMVEME